MALGVGPAVAPAQAASTTVLSQSWETGLKSEKPTAIDPLTEQPDQWLIFSGGRPARPGSAEAIETGTPAAGTPTLMGEPYGGVDPVADEHNFWHIQASPENVCLNPEVLALVTLGDEGCFLKPVSPPNELAFAQVSEEKPTESTGFCGSDFASTSQEPKNGCQTNGEKPQVGSVVSPPFDVKGAESATLHMKSWFDVQSLKAKEFDVMEIEYTTQSGSTGELFEWHALRALNPPIDPGGTRDQDQTNKGTVTPPSWEDVEITLPKAATESTHTRLRFAFDTFGRQSNGFRGWHIDDVSVVAQQPEPPEPVTPPAPPPVVTTTSPPPKQTPTPTPTPVPTPVPLTKPPFAKLIIIYEKSGEIETEYDFPEGGIAEEGAEVLQGATIAVKGKKCKKGFVRKGRRCVSNKPVQYGRTRLMVPGAGHYNLRIKPTKRIMTALKSGKRLKVQLTLMFTPAGTTHHIRIVHNVAVVMKHRPKKRAKH